ncbi:MAG: heat-inducible transcription repressor HrcA [Clostridia bacterium]|nr:heat-inducible transcription repressor HrcA [Clostridia bacterium]
MEDKKELDQRKAMILKAVIDNYIESFEPVGSRTIAKRYDMGLSSATIRNEMADLEEMGYLSSPHTSSGRVPSTKGYRTYVDNMLKPAIERPELASDIISKLEDKMTEYGKLIRACAEIISDITQYIAIGTTKGSGKVIVKAVQLVPVDDQNVLVVMVPDGSIKSKLVKLPAPISADRIIGLSSVFNRTFSGKPAEFISLMSINRISDEADIARDMLLPITDGIFDCIRQCEADEFFTEGASRLLKCPEFDSVDKARDFIDMIQDKDVLEQIVNLSDDESGLTVSIGTENASDGLSDFSVVSAKFNVDGNCIGSVSVVGPTRMDYQKVISSLEYMKRMLEKKAATDAGPKLLEDKNGEDQI